MFDCFQLWVKRLKAIFTVKFNADSIPNQNATGVSNPIVVEQKLKPMAVW